MPAPWDARELRAARNADVGQCTAAVQTWDIEYDDEVPLLMVEDGSEFLAVIYTRANFGCVLFEEKPAPNAGSVR